MASIKLEELDSVLCDKQKHGYKEGGIDWYNAITGETDALSNTDINTKGIDIKTECSDDKMKEPQFLTVYLKEDGKSLDVVNPTQTDDVGQMLVTSCCSGQQTERHQRTGTNDVSYEDVPHIKVETTCEESDTDERFSEKDTLMEDIDINEEDLDIKLEETNTGTEHLVEDGKIKQGETGDSCKIQHVSEANEDGTEQGVQNCTNKSVFKHVAQFECETCYKKLATPYSLAFHKRIHTGEKHYRCGECSKAFIKSSDLKRHRLTHVDQKPFQCDTCDKRFTQSGSLARHRLAHSGGRSYKCEACNRRFLELDNFTTHRCSRLVGACTCPVSNKAFTRFSELEIHKRVHSGEKSFRCDVCSKGFAQSGNLTKHRHIHSGEKLHRCNVYGREFRQSQHLVTHRLTHTGERPYRCDVCHKEFAQLGNLTIHRVIHTDEKPYKCCVCVKVFRRSRDLVTHRRLHHH